MVDHQNLDACLRFSLCGDMGTPKTEKDDSKKPMNKKLNNHLILGNSIREDKAYRLITSEKNE